MRHRLLALPVFPAFAPALPRSKPGRSSGSSAGTAAGSAANRLAALYRCCALSAFVLPTVAARRPLGPAPAQLGTAAVAVDRDMVSQPFAEVGAVASLEAVVSRKDAEAKARVLAFARAHFGGRTPLPFNKAAEHDSTAALLPTSTTRSFWSAVCKAGYVLVNGETTARTRILKEGDVVRFLCSPSAFSPADAHVNRVTLNGLEVPYEDDHVAVVWKAPGITYPAFEKALPQLLLQPANRAWPPRCLIRLEKSTSGLTVCAKTHAGYDALWRLISEGRLGTRWRAICHGNAGNVGVAVERRAANGGSALSAKLSVVSLTPSNQAGTLSDVAIEYYPQHPPKSMNPLQALRPHLELPLFVPENPFVAGANFTHSGASRHRGKKLSSTRCNGIFLSLTELWLVPDDVDSPNRERPCVLKPFHVKMPPPGKFSTLLARDAMFHARAQQQKGLEYDGPDGSVGDIGAFSCEEDTTVDKPSPSGTPIAYAMGSKMFFGLRFKVDPNVLIPRQCTESVVQCVLDMVRNQECTPRSPMEPLRILDVGTGSGCILVSLLRELKSAVGVGTDISEGALQVARQNAETILGDIHENKSFGGVRTTFVINDMSQLSNLCLPEDASGSPPFDVVVCNPPYLDGRKADQYGGTISAEPPAALFCGLGPGAENGFGYGNAYSAYDALADQLSATAPRAILRRGSVVALETGSGMAGLVRTILMRSGAFEFVRTSFETPGVARAMDANFSSFSPGTSWLA